MSLFPEGVSSSGCEASFSSGEMTTKSEERECYITLLTETEIQSAEMQQVMLFAEIMLTVCYGAAI